MIDGLGPSDTELIAARERLRETSAQARSAMQESRAARDHLQALERERLSAAAGTGDLDVVLRAIADCAAVAWSPECYDLVMTHVRETVPGDVVDGYDPVEFGTSRVVVPSFGSIGRNVPAEVAPAVVALLDRFAAAFGEYPDTVAMNADIHQTITYTRSSGQAVLDWYNSSREVPEKFTGTLADVLRHETWDPWDRAELPAPPARQMRARRITATPLPNGRRSAQ